MGSWSGFLFVYLLGGITFIPLVLLTIFLHALYTSPRRPDLDHSTATNANGGRKRSTSAVKKGRRGVEGGEDDRDSIVLPGDDTEALDEATKDKDSKWSKNGGGGEERMEVASGYFAVCREYTPMGINAKPIERATPAGGTTVVAAPSQSVYQTMYRSIFERRASNNSAATTAAGVGAGTVDNNSMSQRPRKAGNVFFVVLRHGHLMLFDDEEQIEVRHVISLAHHDVSVYSGGDVTPEGELWIKRNALCLSRRTEGSEKGSSSEKSLQPSSKPFYLFSENCSAKEDFYFALLKNQEQTFGESAGGAPKPKNFDVKNMITLVQKLHSTEDNVHSRWVNALLGRVFLSIYQTKDLETYINEKITKKIARVKKPSFLTNINIQKIDTGEGAPFFHNLKLKELNVEGETCIEADVRYTGNFRIEVAATAKIDLGPRFKSREVNLLLALVLKKVEGHAYLRIKPPPSNRAWVSFEKMPKMEMAIEPIVSSRQITYTVILRQIENRIKEVVAETLVQPFWDDLPFFKTEHKKWRGGIFEGDDAVLKDINAESAVAQTGDVEALDKMEENPELLAEATRPIEKSHSMPAVAEAASTAPGLFGRKAKGAANPAPSAASTGVETTRPVSTSSGAPSPRILHTAPEPVVGTDAAHADLYKPSTSPPDHATSYMAALHSRSQDASPAGTPAGSPHKGASGLVQKPSITSLSLSTKDTEKENDNSKVDSDNKSVASSRRNTASSVDSSSLKETTSNEPPHSPALSMASSFKDQAGSIGRSFFARADTHSSTATTSSGHSDGSHMSSQKKNTLAAVTNAAAQARQWGWNAIQRQKDLRKAGETTGTGAAATTNPPVDLSQPMGRGQPLPPPGTPLPRPTNGMTKIGPPAVPSRKPVPSASPERAAAAAETSSEENLAQQQQAPPLPVRRRRGESYDLGHVDDEPGMLVVAAPEDSEPETPDLHGRSEFIMTSASGGASVKSTGADDSDDEARQSSKGTSTEPTQVSTVPSEATVKPEGPVPEDSVKRKPVHQVHTDSSGIVDDDKPPTEPVDALKATATSSSSASSEHMGSSTTEEPIATTQATGATTISTPPPAAEAVDDDDDYSGWMEKDISDYDEDEEDVVTDEKKATIASGKTEEETKKTPSPPQVAVGKGAVEQTG